MIFLQENAGVDVLALHSCVMCNEIFTKEADLLDHAISVHSSNPLTENLSDVQQCSNVIISNSKGIDRFYYVTVRLAVTCT